MAALVPGAPRQPGQDSRERRLSDLVAQLVTHFFQTAQIVQTGPGTYELKGGTTVTTVTTIVNNLVTNNYIQQGGDSNYYIQVGSVVRITGAKTTYLGVDYYPALKRGFTTGTGWQDSGDTAWIIHPITGKSLITDGTGIYTALTLSSGVTISASTRPLLSAIAQPPPYWDPPLVQTGCDPNTETPVMKYICRDGTLIDDPADCS